MIELAQFQTALFRGRDRIPGIGTANSQILMEFAGQLSGAIIETPQDFIRVYVAFHSCTEPLLPPIPIGDEYDPVRGELIRYILLTDELLSQPRHLSSNPQEPLLQIEEILSKNNLFRYDKFDLVKLKIWALSESKAFVVGQNLERRSAFYSHLADLFPDSKEMLENRRLQKLFKLYGCLGNRIKAQEVHGWKHDPLNINEPEFDQEEVRVEINVRLTHLFRSILQNLAGGRVCQVDL